MNYYVDVILPLPLKGTFTYELSQDEFNKLEIGFRVAVSFGKRKIYTGIVNELHNNKPELYETKPIEFIYDDKSLVSQNQIDFWNWLSRYYFVPIGDVMKAAVPSTFLLESDSLIIKKEISDDVANKMSDEEYLIYDALDFQNLKLNDISEILNKKNPYPIIQKMILNGYVELNYELKEKYRPKLLNVIFLESRLIDEINIKDSLDLLNRTPKQKELLLSIISMIQSKDYLIIKDLKKTIKFSDTTLKSLEKKGFITIKKLKIDRNHINDIKIDSSNSLTKLQNNGKYYLKKIAEKYLDKELIYRDKFYFPVPPLKILKGQFYEYVKSILTSDACRKRGIYNYSYIENILSNPNLYFTRLNGNTLWHLGLLERWLQLNVDS